MEQQTLCAFDVDASKEYPCIITVSTEEPWTLAFKSDYDEYTTAEADLFECLRALRRHLELKRIVLLCQGARVDVYPSGLSRELTGGRRAYMLHMGERTYQRDLVDIFSPSEQQFVGTVEEQDAYFEAWLKSFMIDIDDEES
jgi:hypothetical protein